MVRVRAHTRVIEDKFKVGDIAEYQGERVRVTSTSYIGHPELLIGGERAASGFYVMLEPLDENLGMDIEGWINARRVKKI